MRYVIALFDAPFPLRQALAALAEAGVGPDDVAVVARDAELVRHLRALGVPADDAADYAEGVARGAALVVVRSPTLGAARIAAELGLGAPDLDTHRMRWQANPGLLYRVAVSDSSPDPLDFLPAHG